MKPHSQNEHKQNTFAGFISALSTKTMYDEQGKPIVYIDEELRRRLETKLIAKIPTFKVA